MSCAQHESNAAEATCAICQRALCSACVAYDVDSRPTCELCGRAEEDRRNSLGSTVLVLTGLGYLLTLALGVVVFRPRPFVGGVAALVALALGRVLQIVLRPPVVVRRLRRS